MYSDRLLDHFQNPRNAGELEAPAVTVEVSNPACGDTMRLSARIVGGKVEEARFRTRGCTASIAAGSVLTEWMAGKGRSEVAGLRPELLEEMLGGLSAESRHAAVLCCDAVKALLRSVASIVS